MVQETNRCQSAHPIFKHSHRLIQESAKPLMIDMDIEYQPRHRSHNNKITIGWRLHLTLTIYSKIPDAQYISEGSINILIGTLPLQVGQLDMIGARKAARNYNRNVQSIFFISARYAFVAVPKTLF